MSEPTGKVSSSLFDTISADDKDLQKIGEGEEARKYWYVTGLKGDSRHRMIFSEDGSQMVSRSWKSEEWQLETAPNGSYLHDGKPLMECLKELEISFATPCTDGPLLGVWVDEDGETQISTRSQIYNTREKGSHRGGVRFSEVFLNSGGQRFIDAQPGHPGWTSHFMVMTPETDGSTGLIVTSRIPLRDLEAVVVYLGTVDLDGGIHYPETYPEDVFMLWNNPDHIFPTREELGGRILVPKALTGEEVMAVLYGGYEYPYQSVFPETTRGDAVVVRTKDGGIIKLLPPHQPLRNQVCEGTPSVTCKLFQLLEDAYCRRGDDSSYSDKWPSFGTLCDDQLMALLKMLPEKEHEIGFSINAFIRMNYEGKVMTIETTEEKMRNILTVCLLSCPLSKVKSFIHAWFNYNQVRGKVSKWIKARNAKIREGHYDESLRKFHSKALGRIKDWAKHSKIYASDNSKGRTYASRMSYSLKGLADKEFGPSLYRMQRAIDSLQEEELSSSSKMEAESSRS